jgi:hypothetical protein
MGPFFIINNYEYIKKLENNQYMKIGITLGLNKENESLWVNGIKLNALNLLKTLQQIEGYEAYILNTSKVLEDLTKVVWDTKKYPIYYFNDKFLETDLIIMLGTSLPDLTINLIKEKNPSAKVIKYQCGNNYVIDMERVIFDTVAENAVPSWDGSHDETWLIPQQEHHNLEYFQTIYRQNKNQLKVVPFVWDPEHMNNTVNLLKRAGKKIPQYIDKPRAEKKLSVMEPNMNVVKYSIIPLMIAEANYRKFGEGAFKQIYIGSGKKILKSRYYKEMIKRLDLVKHNPPLVKYVSRYPIVTFLAEETDIVISHQWGNPLNYAYLDAMYFGYPLVHNAEFIKDAGYYYKDFKINDGAKQLEKALSSHNPEEYAEKNKSALNRYLSTNPAVVETYRKLIENLFEPGKHKMSHKYDWKTNLYK